MRTKLLILALAIIVIGVAVWAYARGVGPLPAREHCSATVGGHRVTLTPEKADNATIIAAVGVRRGLPARAVSIALATAYQESKLRNIDYGDRDSLGLFQQRPSQGWGTRAQVQDPYYASGKFFDALAKIDGFETMRITEAAQRVQRSGYPDAYEPHAADARALASALTGYSPGGKFSCVVRPPQGAGSAEATVILLESGFGPLDVSRQDAQNLQVVVGDSVAGRRLGWAIAQHLTAHAAKLKVRSVGYDGKRWQSGDASEDGWVDADRPAGRVTISLD